MVAANDKNTEIQTKGHMKYMRGLWVVGGGSKWEIQKYKQEAYMKYMIGLWVVGGGGKWEALWPAECETTREDSLK